MTEETKNIDLANLNSAQVYKIIGAGANEQIIATYAGDVNGDGFMDILVGGNNGRSYLIFGKPNSSSNTEVDLAELTGDQGFVINGSSNNALSNFSPNALGDINHDGYADIGVYTSSGKAFIIYGKNSFSQISLDDFTNDLGYIIFGVYPNNEPGHARISSIGDYNKDGYDDYVIASDLHNVYLIYGEKFPQDKNVNDLNAEQGFKISGNFDTMNVIVGVSYLGDVNGDGYKDFAITFNKMYSESTGGMSYIMFGNATSTSIDLNSLTSDKGIKITGTTIPISVTSGVGDLNGDGIDDIVIGGVGDSDYINQGGAVRLFFGSKSLGDMNDDAGIKIYNSNPVYQEHLGVDVSIKDFNGDGIDDLIIGAFDDSSNGKPHAGATYVIFGKKGGFTDIDLANFTPEQGIKIYGANAWDLSGIISNEMNTRFDNNILISSVHADPHGRIDAGEVYVIYGQEPKKTCPVYIRANHFKSTDKSDTIYITEKGAYSVNCNDGFDKLFVNDNVGKVVIYSTSEWSQDFILSKISDIPETIISIEGCECIYSSSDNGLYFLGNEIELLDMSSGQVCPSDCFNGNITASGQIEMKCGEVFHLYNNA